MTLDGLLATLENRAADTPDTSCNKQGYQRKPAWIKGCTPDTPDTPRKADTPAQSDNRSGQPVPAEPYAPTLRPLSIAQETAIRAWLASIGETDPEIIRETLTQCAQDAGALAYFLGRAATDPFLDDRRTCRQCLNLQWGLCRVASPGGLVSANKGYRPVPDILQRCAGYLPGAEDADQRPGVERWPGLNQVNGFDTIGGRHGRAR